jgi:hypothetical protein
MRVTSNATMQARITASQEMPMIANRSADLWIAKDTLAELESNDVSKANTIEIIIDNLVILRMLLFLSVISEKVPARFIQIYTPENTSPDKLRINAV